MHWKLKTAATSDPLKDLAAVPRLIRRLLAGRDIDEPEHARRFLESDLRQLHDPFLMPDMDRAVSVIDETLQRGGSIFIFGDYDVDGITSATLAHRYLRALGATARVHIPNRFDEGYGLSEAVIREAHAWGAGLLIATDCGTTSVAEVALARRLGMQVVVADHHRPDARLPEDCAVVNPWRSDSEYPFRDLCAAGVVTKLLDALHRRRFARAPEEASPYQLCALSALGTVADGVALVGENRILVRAGLDILRSNPPVGMKALLDNAGLSAASLSSTSIAYQIVPRLNAAGRLGTPQISVELLECEDPGRARALAAELDRLNAQRRRLTESVEQAAFERVRRECPGDGAIVLASEDWHLGVLGIAASRLAQKLGRPTILLNLDGEMARGSGRTAAGVDLVELVRRCSGVLDGFGGHEAAVGLRLRAGMVESFREAIGTASVPLLKGAQDEAGRLWIDADLQLNEIDDALIEWLGKFEPFGAGNEEPVFAVRGRSVGDARIVGKNHARFSIGDGRRRFACIGWNLGDHVSALGAVDDPIHIAASVGRDTFRGEDRIQLVVKDISLDDPFRIA